MLTLLLAGCIGEGSSGHRALTASPSPSPSPSPKEPTAAIDARLRASLIPEKTTGKELLVEDKPELNSLEYALVFCPTLPKTPPPGYLHGIRASWKFGGIVSFGQTVVAFDHPVMAEQAFRNLVADAKVCTTGKLGESVLELGAPVRLDATRGIAQQAAFCWQSAKSELCHSWIVRGDVISQLDVTGSRGAALEATTFFTGVTAELVVKANPATS